jgi:hypothetical protein
MFLAVIWDRAHAGQHRATTPVVPRKTNEPLSTTPAHRRRDQVLNEETAMHPVMGNHLAKAYVANLRDRAQRDALVRAARRGRRSRPGCALSSIGAWGRRTQALIARITRGYQRGRDSRVAQTVQPAPFPIGTRYETRPHCWPPNPNSGLGQ